MLRLLLTLLCGLTIAVTLLGLRQQRLELQHANHRLHDDILRAQTTLWRQQVQIAAATAPRALQSTLSHLGSAEAQPPVDEEWTDSFAAITPAAAGDDW